jgi:ABC-type Fe3+-siderophore transport system permease subunit
MDVKTQNIKLSSLIITTGGVTFLAYAFLGIFGFVALMFPPTVVVYFGLKSSCLITNLAWYWISANGEMREATDKIFSNVCKFILYVIKS